MNKNSLEHAEHRLDVLEKRVYDLEQNFVALFFAYKQCFDLIINQQQMIDEINKQNMNVLRLLVRINKDIARLEKKNGQSE